jgi:hypothetical protein
MVRGVVDSASHALNEDVSAMMSSVSCREEPSTLEYNLRRATTLDKKKQEIVREVFGAERRSTPRRR